MKHLRISALLLAALFFVVSCDEDPVVIPDPTLHIGEVISANTLTLNPSGYAPLSGLLEMTIFAAANVAKVSVNVQGKTSSAGDLERIYDLGGTSLEVPVLGLYADHNNSIKVSFYSSDMDFIADTTFRLQTAAQYIGLPTTIAADKINASQDINDMIFVSYTGGEHNFPAVIDVPFKPFMMDKFADIRWYVDFTGHPDLGTLNYGHGMERLQNGNLYFGCQNTHNVYEIDMMGNLINTWDLPNYEFHHDPFEKSNGNFIVSVSNEGGATVEDVVIELDRSNGNIVNTWDFQQSLQNDRFLMDDGLPQGVSLEEDWLHQNGLTWDDNDNTLIITGREQGVIKVDPSNQVEWIIAPHRNWDMNGMGQDLNQYLLTPLDANDDPITDTAVLKGYTNHTDFEWPWYMHAPLVTPEGTVMVFDNGGRRNYVTTNIYSRAVEYEVDEVNMTVKQKFQYGKEAGQDLFAAIVSDVDYDADLNSVIFAGGTMLDNPNFQMATRFWGKHVEVDRDNGTVIAEYTIDAYKPLFIITFNRTEKMDLYFED